MACPCKGKQKLRALLPQHLMTKCCSTSRIHAPVRRELSARSRRCTIGNRCSRWLRRASVMSRCGRSVCTTRAQTTSLNCAQAGHTTHQASLCRNYTTMTAPIVCTLCIRHTCATGPYHAISSPSAEVASHLLADQPQARKGMRQIGEALKDSGPHITAEQRKAVEEADSNKQSQILGLLALDRHEHANGTLLNANTC